MKTNKALTYLLLTSVIGVQFAATMPAFADGYKVTPPASGIGESLPEIGNPPAIGTQGYNYGTPLKGQVSTIPTGTVFEVTTNATIGTSANQVGEIFSATLLQPVALSGNIVVPAGSELIGQITYIEGAGRISKGAAMDVRFTSVKLPNGQKVPIMAKILTKNKTGTLKGGSIKRQIVSSIATGTVVTAGGTLAGLGIGSLMGSAGGGTLFGLTAGGLFGLGYIFARKGKEVVLPVGTKLNVILEQPVLLSRDY